MVNKNSRPCEAPDFYHPTRPLTAGFHVARRNNECPLRAMSGRSVIPFCSSNRVGVQTLHSDRLKKQTPASGANKERRESLRLLAPQRPRLIIGADWPKTLRLFRVFRPAGICDPACLSEGSKPISVHRSIATYFLFCRPNRNHVSLLLSL